MANDNIDTGNLEPIEKLILGTLAINHANKTQR